MQPHDKDIVIPGYRNTSHITEALLARGPETDSAARPTLIFFRGSTTSSRPGEANYSEGERVQGRRLPELLHLLRCPRPIGRRCLEQARVEGGGVGERRAERRRAQQA